MYLTEHTNFTIAVSEKNYLQKPKGEDFKTLSMREFTIYNLEELTNIIKSGFVLCSCMNKSHYTTTEKRAENFKQTNIIAIDLDNLKTDVSAEYLNNTLQHKPTIIYNTATHLVKSEKGLYSKCRLVYVLDTPITSLDTYRESYYKILSTLPTDIFQGCKNADNCMANPIQYICGMTQNNSGTIINNPLIYSLKDFEGLKTTLSVNAKTEQKNGNTKTQTENSKIDLTLFDAELIQALKTKQDSELISTFKSRYKIVQHTDIQFINGVAELSDEFIELYNPYCYTTFQKDNGETKTAYYLRRYKDGEKRFKQLFIRSQIRKLIKPSITPTEMLFNLVFDRLHIIDNSDNKFTNKKLIEIAYNAYIKPCTIKPIQKHRFKVDKNYIKQNNINMKAFIRETTKQLNYNEIGLYYDCSLTINKNLEVLKSNGVKCCRRTLCNFIKENNLNKTSKNNMAYINNDMNNITSTNRENINPTTLQLLRKHLLESLSIKNENTPLIFPIEQTNNKNKILNLLAA